MRSIEKEFEHHEDLVFRACLHTEKSIRALRDGFKKNDNKFQYRDLVNVMDDSLSLLVMIEKYLTVQMMRDSDDPNPDAPLAQSAEASVSKAL